MLRPVLIAAPALIVGCQAGTLESGEWGKLRYFGELTGTPEARIDDESLEPLKLIPPASDRDGNVYVLYEDINGNSIVYVGQALSGWSKGCPAGEEPLPHASANDAQIHGFLGTSDTMAWYWTGDALAQVNGTTGECKQILDKDPLTVTDLRVIAAVPYVHETPARRTLTAWVQGVNDAYNRLPPYQVVVDLDLRRYVAYNAFEPSDANCVDVLGVGSNEAREEGVVVVAYNIDGERRVEARTIDSQGDTTNVAPLIVNGSEFYVCSDSENRTPEPTVVGQLQANANGVYAGLLSNGQMLAFNEDGGSSRTLPNFDALGMLQHEGDLWVTGVADGRPVLGKVQPSGSVETVIRWESSEKAAQGLQGQIAVLDQRYQPAEPIGWENPVTAMGPWPFISPYPIDEYAIGTTGWLVAGPSFESTLTRTAVAFGPVGITVP
ncbi:MAG: hypothetical protein VX127_01495 [Myxococcota bacterium]|nr:hypothetical protein [Myxococcota bacterium]